MHHVRAARWEHWTGSRSEETGLPPQVVQVENLQDMLQAMVNKVVNNRITSCPLAADDSGNWLFETLAVIGICRIVGVPPRGKLTTSISEDSRVLSSSYSPPTAWTEGI